MNFKLIFDESTPDLMNEPDKSVKFIMERLKINSRTAYDYYNALIHIHFYPSTLKNELNNLKNNIIQSAIKDGMDVIKIFELR